MSNLRPLHLAIQNRSLAEAKTALERDPSQASEPLPGGISPVLFALYNGAPEIAEHLAPLAGPLSIHEAAALNRGPLVAAAVLAQRQDMVSYSPDGWTPLHLAAFFGARDSLLVLVGMGAPLEAISQNPMQNTPLHAAIAGAGGETLAPLMLALGADAVVVGGSGVSALHLAASRGFESLARLLVARGANPNALTEDGRPAAALARERGHLGTAALLEQLAP